MISKNMALTFLIYIFFVVIISFNFLTYSVELSYIKNACFFDSDMLYLHQVFEDVFILKHSFFSWHLTPAPYFFPDMLVFFILETIAQQRVFFVIIAYAIFQYCLLIFLAQQLAVVVMREGKAAWLIYSSLLMTLIFLVLQGKAPYYFAITSAYHFGGFINGLLLILFILKASENAHSMKNFIAISVVAALGSASDMLFVMQFLIPALLSWLIFFGYKNKCIVALMIGATMGLLVKQLITFNVLITFIHIDPSFYVENLKKILQLHSKMLRRNPCAEGMCLFFYAWLLCDMLHCFFRRKKSNIDFFKLIIISSVLMTIFGLALFTVTPAWYMLNYYYFPIVFCWLPFAFILRNPLFLNIQFFVFLVISATAVYTLTLENNPLHYEYYPPVIKCIDEGINQYNALHPVKVKYGIANYWYARVITTLSKKNLLLSPVTQRLQPVSWINNPENQLENYDFAVITWASTPISYRTSASFTLNRTLIEQINGPPTVAFDCNNEVTVMIYGENRLHLLSS